MKKFNIKLHVSIFKEGKTFVAYSPALDLSTAAKTFDEVKRRFTEAVAVFFSEIEKMGTKDLVLSGLGWQKVKSTWQPMVPVAHELQEFRVAA